MVAFRFADIAIFEEKTKKTKKNSDRTNQNTYNCNRAMHGMCCCFLIQSNLLNIFSHLKDWSIK